MTAELKVLSSTALKTTFDDLSPQFEHDTGLRISAAFAPSTQIAKRAAEGETSDVVIVTPDQFAGLVKDGKAVASSRVDIARSLMALAVRRGAPKPDISSAETFKQAMLAAKSLAMSNPVGGGQSGAALARIFEQLGIAEAMKAKSTYGPGGPAGLIGLFLVRGECEVGVQQLPELMAVDGIDIVGPLPDDIQAPTIFAAGLSTSATNLDGARKLLAFLTSPHAKAVLKAKGMDPL